MSVSYFSNFRDPITGALVTKSIGHLISRGYLDNHSSWAKIGYLAALTTPATITPQGGLYSFLGTGTKLTAVSTSTNDSATGSGVRTLTLYYLDYDFAEKSTTIALDGTTPVNTTPADIYRINNIRAATAGATYQATGGIHLITGAGTYGYISTGHTRQRQAVYTVPADKTLYITSCYAMAVNTTANKYALLTMRANYDDKAGTRLVPGFYMPYGKILLESDHISCIYDSPMVVPSKVDLLFNGTASAATSVSINIRGYMEG